MEKMGLLWLFIEPRDLSNKNSKNNPVIGAIFIAELNGVYERRFLFEFLFERFELFFGDVLVNNRPAIEEKFDVIFGIDLVENSWDIELVAYGTNKFSEIP